MDFGIEEAPFREIAADLLVFGVFQDEHPLEALAALEGELPPEFAACIEDACQFESFRGKARETAVLRAPQAASRRLVLFGLGKRQNFDANSVRRLTATIARQFGSKDSCKIVCLLLTDGNAQFVQSAVEGILLGGYSFSQYKAKENGEGRKDKISRLTFAGTHRWQTKLNQSEFSRAVDCGRLIAEATNFARDLIAEPACVMTPTRLAEVALSLTSANLSCTILEEEDVRSQGMGAFLGVSQGSHQPPKFIILNYQPSLHRDMRPVALIGKGVTFDSGGLSLKTAQGMETMKSDMSGAAAVLAVMRAVVQLDLAVPVICVIPACENMPGGGATRPGDILVAMNGTTIEVNNTDAEGRLTLADAICYVAQAKPSLIIDIATLTGAVVTALGRAAAGVMTNDQRLVEHFVRTTIFSGERYWQLPLFDDYREALKSDVADLKNAGSRGEAVSSAAGMFLREFVNGTPWLHLDILGPGWMDKDKEELNKGGTGFGVRSLLYFLLSPPRNVPLETAATPTEPA